MGNNGVLSKYKTKAYVITFASLLVILLAISFLMPSENIVINVEGRIMELSCSRTQFGKRNVLEADVLALDEIIMLELEERFAHGQPTAGFLSRNCMAGDWENVDGEYRVFAYTETQYCIIVHIAGNERYVMNFESNEATEAFYDAILAYMNEI